jgi:hypothetical protein
MSSKQRSARPEYLSINRNWKIYHHHACRLLWKMMRLPGHLKKRLKIEKKKGKSGSITKDF